MADVKISALPPVATVGPTDVFPVVQAGGTSKATVAQVRAGLMPVSLTTDVTGTLPTASGGTGLASAGSAGNVLTSNGTTWVSGAPSATIPSLVFRPGVASAGNHVATWAEVETFITANVGRCRVYLDGSIAACTVPNTANTECYGEVVLYPFDENYGGTLTVADGGRLRNIGLVNYVQINGVFTTTTPLVFDINNNFLTLENYAFLTSGTGTTKPMATVSVASFSIYVASDSYLDNSLAPTIPIVDFTSTAGGATLYLIFGATSFSFLPAVLSANLVKGTATALLSLSHDGSVIFTAQALFLGTVVEKRSNALRAILPSAGATGARPALPFLGEMYFDTTLGTSVWWNGSAWVTGSATPTGAAGGDLSGTYPNPTVAKVNGTSVPATPTAGMTIVASSSTSATWQKVDTTSAAAVLVPTTVNGVVTTNGTALQQASNVLATANALSIGATPATAGNLALASTGTIKSRNAANSANLTLLTTDASDNLFVGFGAGYAERVGTIYIYSTTGTFLGTGAGTTYLTLNAGVTASAFPIIGDSANTSPYGAHGMTVHAMSVAGATDTLTAAEYKNYTIKVTSGGTSPNTIKFPAATDATAYTKYVWNAGAQSLNVQDTSSVAAAAALLPGTGAVFQFSTSAVKQLTAAFTVA